MLIERTLSPRVASVFGSPTTRQRLTHPDMRNSHTQLVVISVLAVLVVVHIFAHSSTQSAARFSAERQSAAVAARVLAETPPDHWSLLPPPPPPPELPPYSPPPGDADMCYVHEHTEYDGPVVIWGATNVLGSPAECCEACRTHRKRDEAAGKVGCQLWVWCAMREGCGSQKFGECWGKAGFSLQEANPRPKVRASGEGIPWTSGTAFTPDEAAAVTRAERAAAHAIAERREHPLNPHVFFDVEITPTLSAATAGASSSSSSGGRIEFVLYAREAPRAAENFRAMCTGERGAAKSFNGMKFYRIIDMFIDQAGQHSTNSIWGTSFDDDPGGLALRHERAGLLSAANSGPDTNSGHFSIVVSPAPHLDGGYTIFGEVVGGMDVVRAINRLDKYEKGRIARVVRAGCTRACEARPEVTPKCKTRAQQKTLVQGRSMHS